MSGSEGYFCMRKLYYYYEAVLLAVLLLPFVKVMPSRFVCSFRIMHFLLPINQYN